MTVQEAKAIFEELLTVPKEMIIKYDSVANDSQKTKLNDIYLAEQVAIESMEKQIPKKPIFVDVRFRHHGKNVSDGQSLDKCYKCPNCNTHIFHVWDSEKYCDHCGQKLDWEEGGTSD